MSDLSKLKIASIRDLRVDEQRVTGTEELEKKSIELEKRERELRRTIESTLFILQESAESLESKFAAEMSSLKHVIRRLGNKLSEADKKEVE